MIPRFRAWDKRNNEMRVVEAINFNRGEFESIGYGITSLRGADEIELMQSTGLFDKTNTEIFEGDIVRFEDCYIETDFLYVNKGIVEWSQGSFTITNRDSVRMEDLLDGEFLDVTIIGNIYENKELLDA